MMPSNPPHNDKMDADQAARVDHNILNSVASDHATSCLVGSSLLQLLSDQTQESTDFVIMNTLDQTFKQQTSENNLPSHRTSAVHATGLCQQAAEDYEGCPPCKKFHSGSDGEQKCRGGDQNVQAGGLHNFWSPDAETKDVAINAGHQQWWFAMSKNMEGFSSKSDFINNFGLQNIYEDKERCENVYQSKEEFDDVCEDKEGCSDEYQDKEECDDHSNSPSYSVNCEQTRSRLVPEPNFSTEVKLCLPALAAAEAESKESDLDIVCVCDSRRSAELTNESTVLNSESAQFTSQTSELTGQPTKSACELVELASESTEVINNSNQLTSETAKLTSESAELTGELAKSSCVSATLTTESATLTSEPTMLTTESATLISEPTTLTTESATLTSEPTTLTTESATLTSAPTMLTTESATLTSEPTTITTESATLITVSATLTTESATLTSEPTESASHTSKSAGESEEVICESAESTCESAKLTIESTELTAESTKLTADSVELTSKSVDLPKSSELCSVHDLPDEVLLHVFKFLSPQELCRHVTAVCRRWHSLAYDHTLWKTLDVSFSHVKGPQLCKVVQRVSGAIRYLNISGLSSISFEDVAVVIKNCPNLIHLNISSLRILIVRLMLLVLSSCHNLQSLDVSGCASVNHGMMEMIVALAGPALRRFNFDSCQLTNDSFCLMMEFVNHVTHLSLNGMSWISEATVQSLINNYSSSLQSLTLEGSNVTDLAMNPLSLCRHLQALSIFHCKKITHVSFNYMTNLVSLRKLVLRKGKTLRSGPLMEFLSTSTLAHLTYLDLSECSLLDNSGVISIAQTCGNSLRILYLSFCVCISDKSLATIASTCFHMEKMELVGLHRLQGTWLPTAVVTMTDLSYVSFQLCQNVRVSLMKEAVRCKPSLTILDLYGAKVV